MSKAAPLLLLAFALLAPASADAPAGERDAELERLHSSLAAVQAEEDSALGQLTRIELAERIGRREAHLLDRQAAALSEQARRDAAQAAALETSIRAQQRTVAGLFVAALRQRRRPALIRPLDYQARLWHRRYGGRLAKLERERIEQWRDQVRELRARRARLEGQARELRRLREDRAGKGREITALRERYKVLLAEVGRRREAYEQGVAALSGTVRALPRSPREGAPPAWRAPVNARVAIPFGPIIDPEYKTRLPHPGFDYDAADGAPVRASAAGRVAYAQWLDGYGETVILEHPGEYLSIYAHLRKPLVAEGAELAAGDLLGLVGDTGSLRGPGLYFEIRKSGDPVDPRGLLDKPAAAPSRGRAKP